MDFTNGRSMGSFHLLDGARICLSYQGQRKLGGKCHQTCHSCPGRAFAKECEEKQGPKVTLIDHMRENAHEGVPAVTGTIKDWCESLIFYQ